MPQLSEQAVIWPLGSGLFRDSTRQAVRQSCSESANVETSICESCWLKVRELHSHD
jgi:hypothetical protein